VSSQVFQLTMLNGVFSYSQEKIRVAPQNQSPWNYMRGLVRQASGPATIPISSLKHFASEFASIEYPDEVRSSHALDLLADIAEQDTRNEDAVKALELLADRYDPIRANYWNWRKSRLTEKASSGITSSA